jgi:aminoglycoside phosphotransferase (APT) family kinase protein
VCLRSARGENHCVVFRTARSDEFGHDRRSDRAAQLLLAWDTFGEIAGHVRPLDVGFIAADGLHTMRDAGEPYLVTTYVDGEPYAADLRRIARAGAVEWLDRERVDALVHWLAALTALPIVNPPAWRRSVRDVLGSGEGLFGIVDAYPPDAPGAPPEALREIERLALDWRWRLRGRDDRLRRIHGDFHPFNILFDAGTRFTVLDASRGCRGDPADDLTALAVNFVFFALENPAGWDGGPGVLWRRLWSEWRVASGDAEAAAVAAPYLAWRLLVVACPRFYPGLPAAGREKLVGLARTVLERGFDPDLAEELFA